MRERTGLTIGEVRRRTGVTRSQLRYWEAGGILSPEREEHHTRSWRIYCEADAEKVRRLLYLIGEGMTLKGAVSKLSAVEERESRGQHAATSSTVSFP
jgi:DNA-binding transcriptional MerR regulator